MKLFNLVHFLAVGENQGPFANLLYPSEASILCHTLSDQKRQMIIPFPLNKSAPITYKYGRNLYKM
jgi:hypothetical protein